MGMGLTHWAWYRWLARLCRQHHPAPNHVGWLDTRTPTTLQQPGRVQRRDVGVAGDDQAPYGHLTNLWRTPR